MLCLVVTTLAGWVWAGEVRISIRDEASGQPMPGRVHLRVMDGQPVRLPGWPFWHDHFVCGGEARLELPPGAYAYTVERGPEFTAAQGEFHLGENSAVSITSSLGRIANLAQEGWWSGETHVHRPLEEIELLMQAEDLHAAQVITWWNRQNPWREKAPPAPAVRTFDGGRAYHALSGEDEREGGALLYCDLSSPLEITAATRHYPSSVVLARQARERGAAWIDAEKPFWWDFPLWLAHRTADTAGIAHNHMNRGGVLENEAWGRARDRAKYPAPHGNALWSLDIYYHALNCGLRLPPSAGSASGVLPNPVGYNRAYVHLEGGFTYEKWRDGLLAGRSFVSNGPLLRVRAGGRLPGHVFKADAPLELELEGRLDSRDPVRTVEWVSNGKAQKITLPAKVRIEESGWFLIRAIADVPHTFRFASTAPWYVEIGGHPMKVPEESARFFVDWCRDRTTALRQLEELNAAQREEVLAPWRAAQAFWEGKLK